MSRRKQKTPVISLYFIPLIFIILIAGSLRFIFLDRVPNAIGGDELTYVLTAKYAYLTGHDITGTWSPLSAFLFQYPPGEHQAELPYFIQLIFSAPFKSSLINTRIPFAFFSIATVFLIYLLVKKLINKNTALLSALMLAINPWSVHIGRTGYESAPTVFFYLLGFYLLVSLHGRKLLLAIPVFFLAFYSYIGMKLIFFPLIVVFCLYSWIQNKKDRKWYLIIAGISFLFVLFFIFVNIYSPSSSRMSDLFLPNSSVITDTVNSMRSKVITNPYTPYFINKFTVYLEIITNKFFRIFSPVYLFLEGDQFFAIYRHGFFYPLDFFFMMLGIGFLVLKHRHTMILLALIIIISTFPQLFHNTRGDFSFHIMFIFPMINIITGAGIWGTLELFSKRWRRIFFIFVMISYTISTINFLLIYFHEYPLGGYFGFELRTLSKYLILNNSKDIPVTVYSRDTNDIYKKYLFYSNSIIRNNLPAIKENLDKDIFQINGITFKSCYSNTEIAGNKGVYIYDTKCGSEIKIPHLSISNLIDAGENYMIFNDTICSRYSISRYSSGFSLQDFNMEQLDEKRFCEIFVNKF